MLLYCSLNQKNDNLQHQMPAPAVFWKKLLIKIMKNWMWIVIGLVIVVAVFYLIRWKNAGVLERNKVPLDQAYLDFQEINEHYRSNLFKIERLCTVAMRSASSPEPIRVFPTVNQQLIIDADPEVDEETKHDYRYYKLDQQGKLVDSIYIRYEGYWPKFIDRFMVFSNDQKAYYTTWPLDGDTTRHHFVSLNADFSWPKDKIDQKIRAVKKSGNYYFFSAFRDHGKDFRWMAFYEQQQWYMLWEKMPGYTQVADEDSGYRYRSDVFHTGTPDPVIPEDVRLIHFYPEEKMEYKHVIGGGALPSSATNWRGKGFFSTDIAGRNFSFKVDQLVVEKEKYDRFKTRLYTLTEPGGAARIYEPAFYRSEHGFALYSGNWDELYIIKPQK